MFSHKEACSRDRTPRWHVGHVSKPTDHVGLCQEVWMVPWWLWTLEKAIVNLHQLPRGDVVFRYILTVRADGRKRDFPPPALPVTEGAAHL